jgi:hypothetical protein
MTPQQDTALQAVESAVTATAQAVAALRAVLTTTEPDPEPDPEPEPEPDPGPSQWAAGEDVGTLSGGTWTPGRNADGLITQASVNALPAGEWVRVAGTSLQGLKSAIEATGYSFAAHDWSNGKDIRKAFVAWVGCCDDGRRVYYPRGGGHADGCLNGVYALDALKMGWEVTRAPSRPDTPGAEWDASYDVPPNSGFSTYTVALPGDDGLYRDMLPDGTPTSAHTYNGVWFDNVRQRIGTGRVSRWDFDLTSKEWQRRRWTWNGSGPTTFTIRQQIYYHAATDTLYGFPGRNNQDYYSFGRCPGDSHEWVSAPTPPNWASVALASCQLDADRVLFLWTSGGSERAGVFDMSTVSWEPGSGNPIANSRSFTGQSEMMAALYIPTWGAAGQVIRRGTGSGHWGVWWLYDIATQANVPYVPIGAAPPYGQWFGNKYRLLPNLGIAMALDDASAISNPAVYVMRY